MLKIYQSNNTNILIDKVCQIMTKNDSNNPIKKEFIIVESNQLKTWIKYQIANTIGIAANINFFKLEKFIFNILNIITMNKYYEYDNFTYDLTWEIMNISENQDISSFIKKTDHRLKKMQFSKYIAKLFKKYSLYRLHDIQSWMKKIIKNDIFHQHTWQIKLLKHCLKNIKKKIITFYGIIMIH